MSIANTQNLLMDNDELKYWVAFSHIPKFGPKLYEKIITYFPNLKQAWLANAAEWENCGISKDIAQTLSEAKQKVFPDQALENVMKENIFCLPPH